MTGVPCQKLAPVKDGAAGLIQASSVKSSCTMRVADAKALKPSRPIAYPAQVEASGNPTSAALSAAPSSIAPPDASREPPTPPPPVAAPPVPPVPPPLPPVPAVPPLVSLVVVPTVVVPSVPVV